MTFEEAFLSLDIVFEISSKLAVDGLALEIFYILFKIFGVVFVIFKLDLII